MQSQSKGKAGGLIPFVVTVIAFGIIVPLWKGLEYFDPLLFLVSLLGPIVFVTPITTEDGARVSPLSRAGRGFLYAALMTLLIGLHGVAIVNVTHWFGNVILPPMGVFLSGILTALVAEGCLALFSVWLYHRTSAERTRLIVRGLFFLLLLLYLYFFRFAPPEVRSRIDEQMTSELLTQALLKISGVLGAAAIAFAILLRRTARGV